MCGPAKEDAMGAVDYHQIRIKCLRGVALEVDVMAVNHRRRHEFVAVFVPFATLDDGSDLVPAVGMRGGDELTVAVVIHGGHALGFSQVQEGGAIGEFVAVHG